MKILERVLNVLIRIVNIPLLVLTVIEYLLVTILLMFVVVPFEFFLVMPVFYIATGKFYYNCDFNYKHYKPSCWLPVVNKMDWYIDTLPVFFIKQVHFGQSVEGIESSPRNLSCGLSNDDMEQICESLARIKEKMTKTSYKLNKK